MRATPQVSNVHDDWLEPVPSLKLEIDQDRARALGVTSQSVRRSLQAIAVRLPDRRVPRRRRDHQGDAARAFRHAQSPLRARQRLCEDGRRDIGAAAPGGQLPAWCWSPESNGGGTGCRRSPSVAWCPTTCSRPTSPTRSSPSSQPLRDRPRGWLSHRAAGRGRRVGQQPDLDQREDAGHAARHSAPADGPAPAASARRCWCWRRGRSG